jgi:hypothetical protein
MTKLQFVALGMLTYAAYFRASYAAEESSISLVLAMSSLLVGGTCFCIALVRD